MPIQFQNCYVFFIRQEYSELSSAFWALRGLGDIFLCELLLPFVHMNPLPLFCYLSCFLCSIHCLPLVPLNSSFYSLHFLYTTSSFRGWTGLGFHGFAKSSSQVVLFSSPWVTSYHLQRLWLIRGLKQCQSAVSSMTQFPDNLSSTGFSIYKQWFQPILLIGVAK